MIRNVIHLSPLELFKCLQICQKPATSYEDWEGGTDLNTLQVKAQKIVEIPMEKLMEEGVRGGNYNKKKVCCTLRNGAEKIFDSVTEAAEFCGVDHSAISNVGACQHRVTSLFFLILMKIKCLAIVTILVVSQIKHVIVIIVVQQNAPVIKNKQNEGLDFLNPFL